MMMYRLLTYLMAVMVVAVLGVTPYATAQPETKVSVGILPTYDSSGERGIGTLVKALPPILFDKLGRTTVQPVMLNPGGLYSPLEEEWFLEYGRTAGVDALLITSVTEQVKKTGRLLVESELVEVASGKRSSKFVASTRFKRDDLDKSWRFDGVAFFGRSKEFERERLGKAARKLADSLSESAALQALSLVREGTFRPRSFASSDRCPIQVRVRYTQKNAASKNYGLILNGREESLGLVDGVATTMVSAGPIVMHVVLPDAPYKLPIQDSYSANTHLDCTQSEKTLVLDVGAAGEAHLRWTP